MVMAETDGNDNQLVSQLKHFKEQGQLKRTSLLAMSFGANSKDLSLLSESFAVSWLLARVL